MTNAELINKKLGFDLYKQDGKLLVLNKFTKKQIKEYCIDDLIHEGRATLRLKKIVNEILTNKACNS